MKKTLLFLFLLFSVASQAQISHCDSLSNAVSTYNAAYPYGSNLWDFTDILNDSMGEQSAVYWYTNLQGCGISYPNIVNCSTVNSLMSAFLAQYPLYDSAAPDMSWCLYLDQNGGANDYTGTGWYYSPDEWQALFIGCGISAPPAPVALATRCDTFQAVLAMVPGLGTASFNPMYLVNGLNQFVYSWQHYDTTSGMNVENDLAYWLPQLYSCGDSCTGILSCSTIDSTVAHLSSYGGSGPPYSLPFAEACLNAQLFSSYPLDSASWRAVLACCSPPDINYADDSSLTHCDSAEVMLLILEGDLPTRSCLPSWVYNYILGMILPSMPALSADSTVTLLCSDLKSCTVNCPNICDDSIISSCDSIHSVYYVYKTLLASYGESSDPGLLQEAYYIMYGQFVPYATIMDQINNCNPNDTAIFTQITYTAANLTYTTDSSGHSYVDMDLMATDTPNLLYSQGNIFVVYDTTIFYSNMVSRGAITATRGTIDSFYTLSLSDSAPNILKLTLVHDSTNTLTNLDSVNTNAQLCHLRINISSFNITAVAAYWDTLVMQGASLYQSTPNGIALPYDKVLVSGLEAPEATAPLTYSIEGLGYNCQMASFEFNIDVVTNNQTGVVLNAGIAVFYNTAVLQSPTVNTATWVNAVYATDGDGIYSYTANTGTAGEIDIQVSPSNDTSTFDPSDANVHTFPTADVGAELFVQISFAIANGGSPNISTSVTGTGFSAVNNYDLYSISSNTINTIQYNPVTDNDTYTTQICASGINNIIYSDSFTIHPNPFNNNIMVDFSLRDVATVTLNIEDILGQQILSKQLGSLTPGVHNITIPMPDDLTSGVYILSYIVNGNQNNIKIVKQ